MSVKYQNRIRNDFVSIFVQFLDNQYRLDACPTSRIGVCQINFTIIIPNWARIYQSFSRFNYYWFRPWAINIFRGSEINSKIRIRIINVKFAIVVSDTWSPNTTSMSYCFEMIVGYQRF